MGSRAILTVYLIIVFLIFLQKMTRTFLVSLFSIMLFGCSDHSIEEKGFAVSTADSENEQKAAEGINSNSLALQMRPSEVLLTGHSGHRLATLYRINYTKDSVLFVGSNYTYFEYSDADPDEGNNWNDHLMPGLSAVYGYNLVNVSHFDHTTQAQFNFFQSPVLVKTLYYPSFSRDTLNFQPVLRNYYLVSVYDEDTNTDGFINLKDLRRFYYFDLNATAKQLLIPQNYSVVSSEYDSANDFMYVFAQLDENQNGRREAEEAIHIFWIDLKNPLRTGRMF